MNAIGPVPDNMRLWNAVSKTDPANTKRVQQRGGFTAISAHSQIMEATKQFGPVGEGWGYECAEIIRLDSMVVVPVTLWHGERGNRFGPIYGCAEMFGNRPDHDAPKKAMTDAITKGLSQLGFNADVFLGLYDDNKYVEQMRREFSSDDPPAQGSPPPRSKLEGAHTSKTALKNAIHTIRNRVAEAKDNEAIDTIMRDACETVKQANRDWPELLNGDPNIGEDIGLRGFVANMREAVRVQPSDALGLLLQDMRRQPTRPVLANWAENNEAVMFDLSDEDRRKFDAEYDAYEAGLTQVATLATP